MRDQCQDCPDGEIPDSDKFSCIPCLKSKIAVYGKCEDCPDDQVPNGDRISCKACLPSQFVQNGTVCQNCTNPGEVPNSEKTGCIKCPITEIAMDDRCQKCPVGQVPNNDRVSCKNCTESQIVMNGTCKKCPDDHVPNSDRSSCSLEVSDWKTIAIAMIVIIVIIAIIVITCVIFFLMFCRPEIR